MICASLISNGNESIAAVFEYGTVAARLQLP
jgi:hypothetical protein